MEEILAEFNFTNHSFRIANFAKFNFANEPISKVSWNLIRFKNYINLSITLETITSEFPQAAQSCVPSFDHAILKSDPVVGFSSECDH